VVRQPKEEKGGRDGYVADVLSHYYTALDETHQQKKKGKKETMGQPSTLLLEGFASSTAPPQGRSGEKEGKKRKIRAESYSPPARWQMRKKKRKRREEERLSHNKQRSYYFHPIYSQDRRARYLSPEGGRREKKGGELQRAGSAFRPSSQEG